MDDDITEPAVDLETYFGAEERSCRIINCVDMGAYEYGICPAAIAGRSVVGFEDLTLLLTKWG